MSEDTAIVTLPSGMTFSVTIERDQRCLTHGGQPGWGCESCRESVVNAIVGFRPVGGWQALHHAMSDTATGTVPQPSPTQIRQRVALPVTLSEPVYDDHGGGVGFRITHPPGVECVFPPNTHQCSCGRLEIGIVRDA